MKASEIIRQDMARNGIDKDEQRFLDGLATMIEQKKVTILQYGNTVVTLYRIADKDVEFHFYTVDKLPEIEKAFAAFWAKVKNTGMKFVSETENFQLVQLAKKIGLPITATRDGKKYRVILRAT